MGPGETDTHCGLVAIHYAREARYKARMNAEDLDRTPGLHRVPDAELLRLMRAIARDEIASPVTRAGLLLARFAASEAQLDALIGQPKNAVLVMLGAVLRERQQRVQARVGLAWAGGGIASSGARDPFELQSEWLATAERSVVWSGARLDRDQRLLRALLAAVETRGLEARVIVDAAIDGTAGVRAASVGGAHLDEPRAASVSGAAGSRATVPAQRSPLAQIASELLRGSPARLGLYVPESARLRGPLPRYLAVDERRALILSGAAPELEADEQTLSVGASIEEPAFCAQLSAQTLELIAAGALVPLLEWRA